MKDITAPKFLRIVLEEEPHLRSLGGRDIIYMKSNLSRRMIQNDLSLGDFVSLERQYPEYLRIEDTSIFIKDSRSLKSVLDKKLLFCDDGDVNNEVKVIWKSRKRSRKGF